MFAAKSWGIHPDDWWSISPEERAAMVATNLAEMLIQIEVANGKKSS